jgi:hypothetical protein
MAPTSAKTRPQRPLKGVRIISLALNLPGPAALRRLADMGARCLKVNPPAGDAMQAYTPQGYGLLHQGIQELTLDLKDPRGRTRGAAQAPGALRCAADLIQALSAEPNLTWTGRPCAAPTRS